MTNYYLRGLGLLFILNAAVFVLLGESTWRYSIPVQGLALNAFGALILAIPDIPQIRWISTPVSLRSAWQRLDEDGKIRKDDTGFDALVDLIDEHTGRVPDDHDFDVIQTGPTEYGNPDLFARFESDPESRPARYQLTSWVTLTMWINEVRDRIRVRGIFLFLLGFVVQLLGIALV